jgi:hypothetical protein
MSEKTVRLGHQFAVDAVSGFQDIDTLLNIVKRREKIIYRSNVLPANANISYLTNSEKASSVNVSVVDRSTSLTANSKREENILTQSTIQFISKTTNFQITNIYTDLTASIPENPLFLQHTIDTTHLDRVSSTDLTVSGVKLLDVELLDSNQSPIQVEDYKVDFTKGIVYSNLETTFTSNVSYELYYLKYTLSDSSSNIVTYTVLLDNNTVYNPAEFDDLDEFMEIIVDGRKVYLVTENESYLTVTLPVLAQYSLRSINSARIQVLHPAVNDITNTWLARVTNGTFLETVKGNLRRYHIAEFLNQSWEPEAPYKRILSEVPTVITSTILKLDHTDIKEDTDELDLYVDIRVNNKKGEGLAAYTTSPVLESSIASNGQNYKKWNTVSKVGIKSIDHSTGFVEIQGISLQAKYSIEVDYYYKETNYEFTSVDFNPTNNVDALDYRIALILEDDEITTSKDQTLYYLQVDEESRVVDSNWPDFDTTVTGYADDGLPIYYDNYPDWLTTTTGTYLFTNDFSVESTTASGIENFLILADISVSEALDPHETNRIDSRMRGGGIIDRYEDTINEIQPESQWYYDIGRWDGKPYPGNASYMVEVPVDILEGAGGTFKTNEVSNIINRHTAAGVYAVKRAYGIEVTITGVIPLIDGINIGWVSYEY